VWPVDEPGRVAELVDLGVEVVITNDVPSARAALATL
jgi:glycerophosphoryl diester phosphodiesterase